MLMTDMRAICETLGFDPTNHHNAARCPYCRSEGGMLLTGDERERFATWLEREANTASGLVEQMEKLGPHAAPMVAREKAEAAAALLIARKLRAIHSESIG